MKEFKKRETVFRFEHEMAESARNWMAHQGLMVKEEFSTPWGICDFVGVSLNKTRVGNRLRLGQREAIGPLERVAILWEIPDIQTARSTTVDELAMKFGDFLSPENVRAEIEMLLSRGFVRVSRELRVQKVNGWVPLHKRIVALELKLKRVEDALAQAASHLAFAEESFVGLPSGLAERIASSHRAVTFGAKGVGILAVGSKECRVVFRPRTRDIPKDIILQMHCIERFWRTRVKGN